MKNSLLNILTLILNNPGITLDDLEEKLSLKRTQCEYRLAQANRFLEENQLSVIYRANNQLSLPFSMEKFNLFLESLQNNNRYYHREDRQLLYIFALLLSTNISVKYLCEKLAISKNTAVSDISILKKELVLKDLDISYSRKNGYQIVGDEIKIRFLLANAIRMSMERNIDILNFLNIDESIRNSMRQKLELFERIVGKQFTDFYIDYLSMLLILIHKRHEIGQAISRKQNNELRQVILDEDFELIKAALTESGLYENENDNNFIIIHLLTANVIRNHDLDRVTYLDPFINEMIEKFEKIMATKIADRDELFRMLKQHLIPAIYRLKCNVEDNPDIVKTLNEYNKVYPIVKKILNSLEAYANISFSYTETMYVALIFLSFLKKVEPEAFKPRYVAVVICQNGVSVSQLLLKTLSDMFPSIIFKNCYSIREFNKLEEEKDLKADIIFSTHFLHTDKKLFLISQFLSPRDKDLLTRRVNQFLYGSSEKSIEVEKILKIVDDYTDINNRPMLEKMLTKYVYDTLPRNVQKIEYKMMDLLTRDKIRYITRPCAFEEAIRIAGEPLLRHQMIEARYIDEIIKNYSPEHPYFVIAPGVAIPHASYLDGVNCMGFSMLKLKHGVYFSKELKVYLILMIAPGSGREHQNTLLNFYNFINDKKSLEGLMTKNSSSEIYEYLMKHFKDLPSVIK